MAGDPELDQLAAAGRRRRARQAETEAEAARREAAERAAALEARRRRADALRSFTTLRSLSVAAMVALVFGILSGFVAMGLGFAAMLVAAMGASFPLWTLGLLVATALPVLLALARLARLRSRDIEFRGARPYAVIGYQRSLDYGRSYPSTDFEIEFEGPPPPTSTLRDVFATLPAKTTVETVEGRVVRCEVHGEGSKFDGHRRWLPRWFYPACTDVFDVLHRSHPIVALRFPGY